jgi:hypothetical protein
MREFKEAIHLPEDFETESNTEQKILRFKAWVDLLNSVS